MIKLREHLRISFDVDGVFRYEPILNAFQTNYDSTEIPIELRELMKCKIHRKTPFLFVLYVKTINKMKRGLKKYIIRK